eukprot:TRINITY_DN91214_c0_g1_i1.p1 TRINITY_DN91214_c0_g1~~TRINITY_DN91214_c0_g1_i1.p1  ORF type:complete len:522 (-),score=29.90 TRINITY_DN91214_c0_g1_i1:62-1576(-)
MLVDRDIRPLRGETSYGVGGAFVLALFLSSLPSALASSPTETADPVALDSVPSQEARFAQNPTGAVCRAVCEDDHCVGTWSNSLPSGEVWEANGSVTGIVSYFWGCCSFALGRCQRCCKPSRTGLTVDPMSGSPVLEGHDDQAGRPASTPAAEEYRDVDRSDGRVKHAPASATGQAAADANELTDVYREQPNPLSETEGSVCKSVCADDKCVGTWSNALPSGEVWEASGSVTGVLSYVWGCCAFALGRCQRCCKSTGTGLDVESTLSFCAHNETCSATDDRGEKTPPRSTGEPTSEATRVVDSHGEQSNLPHGVESTVCKAVCEDDACVGTWSNSLPYGEVWEPNGTVTGIISYVWGCCAFTLGRCQRCCKPVGPTPSAPAGTAAAGLASTSSSNPPDGGQRLSHLSGDGARQQPTRAIGERVTGADHGDQSNPSQETGTTVCRAVCADDNCVGTWSNAIPSGEVWEVNGSVTGILSYVWGCCAFTLGRCQRCCTVIKAASPAE